MAKETFAGKIRAACQALAARQETFTVKEIVEEAMIQTRNDEKKMHNTMRDFIKAKTAVRISYGVYSWIGKRPSTGKAPQKQEVMWRIIRAKRVLSRDDLAAMAGVSIEYAKEYLAMLVKHGICKRLNDYRVQLIKDPGPQPPVNEEKAARLRALRKKLKAAATVAKAATTALNEAIAAIEEEKEI